MNKFSIGFTLSKVTVVRDILNSEPSNARYLEKGGIRTTMREVFLPMIYDYLFSVAWP